MEIEWLKGFSYVEVIMALAIFCIAAAPVFPTLSQARQNADYAYQAYRAHTFAQEMTLTVRNALAKGEAPSYATSEGFLFSVWVSANGEVPVRLYASEGAPEWPMVLTYQGPAEGAGNVVVTMVWNADGYLIGRGMGVFF